MRNPVARSHINLDAFRNLESIPEGQQLLELGRRLTLLAEQVDKAIKQLQGDQLVNLNVTYYGDQEVSDPSDPDNGELSNQKRYSFNITGDTVMLQLSKGRVKS